MGRVWVGFLVVLFWVFLLGFVLDFFFLVGLGFFLVGLGLFFFSGFGFVCVVFCWVLLFVLVWVHFFLLVSVWFCL